MLATKQILPFFLAVMACLLIYSSDARAQDFDQALDQYQQQQYREALRIFEELPSDRARLFTGKSYFALGEYLKAKDILTDFDSSVADDIYREALYTAALTDMQLRDYSGALEKFHSLQRENQNTGLSSVSAQGYEDLLGFLTLEQRRTAFRTTELPEIRADLIRSAMGRVSYSTARTLVETYRRSLSEESENTMLRELEELTADSVVYANKTASGSGLSVPEGMVYDIGIALPVFNPEDPEFTVSQGLYYGYLLAVEDFNQSNQRVKAVLRHRNTGADGDSAAVAMNEFAWNHQTAAVIGPLFSEAAAKMAPLAENYELSMLAPLANSDSLNFDNPYVYQANPTFAVHGEAMARFARRELQLDTLAVLVERGTFGEASAYAFRDEFEKLGGKVSYFFSENLESQGYEINDYTRYFTADTAVIDSLNFRPVEAVYAPFTGQAAQTLMELLLIDLNATNPDIPVLGSPEWGSAQLSNDRINNRDIYYTESYLSDDDIEAPDFNRRYRERFGTEPNRFSMIGYDVAGFLLEALRSVQNPDLLKSALKNQPVYGGLIGEFRFDGTHINQQVRFKKLEGEGQSVTVPFNR